MVFEHDLHHGVCDGAASHKPRQRRVTTAAGAAGPRQFHVAHTRTVTANARDAFRNIHQLTSSGTTGSFLLLYHIMIVLAAELPCKYQHHRLIQCIGLLLYLLK
jgi:hypothetical protein